MPMLSHLLHSKCRISGVESNLLVFMLQQCPVPKLDYNLLGASRNAGIYLWCLTDVLDVNFYSFIMVSSF